MLDVNKILEMNIMLTTERDYNLVMDKIILCAMDLTNCEGGTLYLYDEDKNRLDYMVMRNVISGIQKNAKSFKPVEMQESNMSAYSAMHRKMVNVKDVYDSDEFDFTGPKKYDEKFGYHTKSMLAFPLINHEDELIGVVQLINARTSKNELTEFSEEHEMLLKALASMAAVSLSNMQYIGEITDLLHSIVDTFTNAIDARTPYNYSHSKNVHDFAEKYVNYNNELYEKGESDVYYDEDHKEQLLLAAWMHDIGKLVTPLAVMNKPTRLSDMLEPMLLRFKYIRKIHRIDWLEGRISGEEYEKKDEFLATAAVKINEINNAGFLQEAYRVYVDELAAMTYVDEDGEEKPYITEKEYESLRIIKGTLTDHERQEMQRHVVYTDQFLERMHIDAHYKNVRSWAGKHHEYLNGTGYPKGLTAEEIPPESRILTIVDVYDALTCADRPYKKAHTPESAFGILTKMAEDGQIDGEILRVFSEAVMKEKENV